MGPADSVSLIAASPTSLTSSKFFRERQIELERRRSDLQVLEDFARSRKSEAEAKAEAAAEEETLAKSHLEAIELEAEEKRIAWC